MCSVGFLKREFILKVYLHQKYLQVLVKKNAKSLVPAKIMCVVSRVTERTRAIHFENQTVPLKCWGNCIDILEKSLLPCVRKNAAAVSFNFVTNSPQPTHQEKHQGEFIPS